MAGNVRKVLLAVTILAALVIVVGLVGVVVPVLPGTALVLLAVVVWAFVAQHAIAWVVLIFAIAMAVAGWVLQYMLPTRRMQAYGVPKRTLIVGAVAAAVGLFLFPPLGLPLGFVLGVFGAECARLRSAQEAWPSAVQALKAAAVSYGIELTTAVMIALAFAIGASFVLSGSLDAVPSPTV